MNYRWLSSESGAGRGGGISQEAGGTLAAPAASGPAGGEEIFEMVALQTTFYYNFMHHH